MDLSLAKRTKITFSIIILSLFLASLPQACLAVNLTFTYDAAGRLLKAQFGDGQVVAYTYDPIGNMTQQISSGFGVQGLVSPIIQLLLNHSIE